MKHDDEASFLIVSEIEKGWIKSKTEEQELSPEIKSAIKFHIETFGEKTAMDILHRKRFG
jgi:hypothetical protein